MALSPFDYPKYRPEGVPASAQKVMELEDCGRAKAFQILGCYRLVGYLEVEEEDGLVYLRPPRSGELVAA